MKGFNSYRLAFLSLTLLFFASLQGAHYHHPDHTGDFSTYSDTGSVTENYSHCMLCVSGANHSFVTDTSCFNSGLIYPEKPEKNENENLLLTQLYSNSGRSPPSFA